MYRVFVHIYIHHFDTLTDSSAVSELKNPLILITIPRNESSCSLQVPHVNLCYKHYYYFITEFNLVSKKELEPLVRTTMKFQCYNFRARSEL